MFDDALLDDASALRQADDILRRLAGAGARIRVEHDRALPALAALTGDDRPRAVIAAGTEARLVRALLEPVCPVPFVAWPQAGLPGWVGVLDLVVVLAPDPSDTSVIGTVREAARRGARMIVAAPTDSLAAEHASPDHTWLSTSTGDPLAAAAVVLAALHRTRLGPPIEPEQVAAALDATAEDCSPFVDIAANPAKDLALGLADAQPLLWGGSVLAARASRRVAEALRAASGRPALAADADALLPVIEATSVRDPFADPFEQPAAGLRPALIILDDGFAAEPLVVARRRLVAAAERADVRVCVLSHDRGTDLERYAVLLQSGQYAAAYLAVGLGMLG